MDTWERRYQISVIRYQFRRGGAFASSDQEAREGLRGERRAHGEHRGKKEGGRKKKGKNEEKITQRRRARRGAQRKRKAKALPQREQRSRPDPVGVNAGNGDCEKCSQDRGHGEEKVGRG